MDNKEKLIQQSLKLTEQVTTLKLVTYIIDDYLLKVHTNSPYQEFALKALGDCFDDLTNVTNHLDDIAVAINPEYSE